MRATTGRRLFMNLLGGKEDRRKSRVSDPPSSSRITAHPVFNLQRLDLSRPAES
jgi:hypothetical protein